VRDLKQLVGRILHRHAGGGLVTVGDLPPDERPGGGCTENWRNGLFEDAVRRALSVGAHLKDIRRAAEETAVRLAVTDEEGNLQRAASRLGVTDRALQLRRSAGRLAD
jgi:transcriptional regulator with PAS, ATPase and Fis domain